MRSANKFAVAIMTAFLALQSTGTVEAGWFFGCDRDQQKCQCPKCCQREREEKKRHCCCGELPPLSPILSSVATQFVNEQGVRISDEAFRSLSEKTTKKLTDSFADDSLEKRVGQIEEDLEEITRQLKEITLQLKNRGA